jgi:ADP-heptose:LPS heptosyltransferase
MHSKKFHKANCLYRKLKYIDSYALYSQLEAENPYFKHYNINKSRSYNKIFRNFIKQLNPNLINENKYFKNEYMQIEGIKSFKKIKNIDSKISKTNLTNILVAKPCGLGNMLMALPALKCLISELPNADITVLCQSGDALALEDLQLKIDVFPQIDSKIKRQQEFKKYLKTKFYDIVLYPPYTALSPPDTTDNIQTIHVQHPEINFERRHEALHNFEILSLLGIKKNIGDYLYECASVGMNSIFKENRYFVIHPGSSNSVHMRKKRWPSFYWASLAKTLSRTHPVLFVGGKDDKSDTDEIFQNIECTNKNIYNLTDIISWKHLKEIISHAAVFVSNDSGLMHLAATTSAPIVAIFGPTNPVKNAPFRFHNTSVLKPNPEVSCAPCYKIGSNKIWTCENQICLKTITPEYVYSEIKKYIS